MSSTVSGEWALRFFLGLQYLLDGHRARADFLLLHLSRSGWWFLPVGGRLALAPQPLIKRSRGWYSQLRLLAPLLRSCLIQPIIGSLGLISVVLREDELNGLVHGGLVGVVLIVEVEENSFIVG
jgi:hypothetical protein